MVNLRPLKDKRLFTPLADRQYRDSGNNVTLGSMYGEDVDKVQVYFHSSADMGEIQDNSVALMVTSPPYNLSWDYGSFEDSKTYTDYLSDLAEVFNEAYKKLMPEGRLCVNIPTIDKTTEGEGTARDPQTPLASDVISMMVSPDGLDCGNRFTTPRIVELKRDTDYKLFDHIIRNKGRLSSNAGLGSLGGGRGYPFRFKLDSSHESILIFQKPGKRGDYGPSVNPSDMPTEVKQASSLDKSWWTTDKGGSACRTSNKDNLWTLPTDNTFNVNGERVPAFPEELPKRLIEAFTYVGDTVVDPFAGVGTTLKVAKDLDRLSIGYELRPELRPKIEEQVDETV